MNIYSVHDSKAGAYLTPFFSPNHAVALRNFVSAANQADHMFHRHAADFTLFHIGTFDEESGRVQPTDVNQPLGTAIDFITTEN